MKKRMARSEREYAMLGRRHRSEQVAIEAGEAASRWERDLDVLRLYGYGREALQRFVALIEEHRAARASRPSAIAAKASSCAARDTEIAAAWAWVDMVGSTLGALARSDGELANALHAAYPEDDADLDASIGALCALLDQHLARVPADADAPARIAEAAELRLTIAATHGKVAGSKSAPVADTAGLDLLDGKLYATVVDLNQAGRRAIRNGKLARKLSEYALHHLNRSGRPAAEPLPAEPSPEPTS